MWTWSAVVLPILTMASVMAAVISRFCCGVRPAYHWIVILGMAFLSGVDSDLLAAIILERVNTQYREEPCRSALNRVTGMPFQWSLNPYMGCVHRCTFCYVRAFEKRADRPSDDRYGASIRVKTNVAEVLRVELAGPSWEGGGVAVGAAT